MSVTLHAVEGLPEVTGGDDVGALVALHAGPLRDGDAVVVAQKVVSKAEGRTRDLHGIVPSARAVALGQRLDQDPRFVHVVLEESERVVRDERVLITETRQGFICANAGVDRSNVPAGCVTLLPLDCDASARRIRERVRELRHVDIAVIVSDTFGRPWRTGIVNVALGVAGMRPLADLRGTHDDHGRVLQATSLAVADELAAAAGLVMGKTRRIPAVVVRNAGVDVSADGSGRELLRAADEDLFR